MKATLVCAGALLMLAGQLSGCVQPGAGDDSDSVVPVAADDAATGRAEDQPDASESVAAVDASADAPFALDRIGDVRIGEAFSADDWLAEWTAAGARELGGTDCEQYSGGTLPAGLSMMVLEGLIARFELNAHQQAEGSSAHRAPFGLRLGQTKAEALALLPEGVAISPHEYEAEGEYLTWRDPKSALGIRLETYLDLVEAIYWGDAEAATLIEGCA